ncbi:MAG: hypothetical protein M3H12_13820 [Chromatiales bacterium]|nr:hypothetical protein [Gammaproteobacteria bacterium]
MSTAAKMYQERQATLDGIESRKGQLRELSEQISSCSSQSDKINSDISAFEQKKWTYGEKFDVNHLTQKDAEQYQHLLDKKIILSNQLTDLLKTKKQANNEIRQLQEEMSDFPTTTIDDVTSIKSVIEGIESGIDAVELKITKQQALIVGSNCQGNIQTLQEKYEDALADNADKETLSALQGNIKELKSKDEEQGEVNADATALIRGLERKKLKLQESLSFAKKHYALAYESHIRTEHGTCWDCISRSRRRLGDRSKENQGPVIHLAVSRQANPAG